MRQVEMDVSTMEEHVFFTFVIEHRGHHLKCIAMYNATKVSFH
jgi:hypothetical protein